MPLPAALSDQISPPLGIRTTPKAFIFPRSTRADRSGGLCEGNLPACSPLCGPAHCLERESWPAASLVGRARRGRGEMGQDVARALKSMQAKLPASVLARPLPEDGRCVTIRVQELRNLQTKAFSVHLRFIDPRTDKPHQIQAYRALSVVSGRAIVLLWIRIPGTSDSVEIQLWQNRRGGAAPIVRAHLGTAHLSLEGVTEKPTPAIVAFLPPGSQAAAEAAEPQRQSTARVAKERLALFRDRVVTGADVPSNAVGVAVLESFVEHLPPNNSSWDLDVAVGPLARPAHLYGHGAFLGAAPVLLRDRRWDAILLALEPRLRTLCLRLARRGGLAGIMTALENSPVLAAFGVAGAGFAPPKRSGFLAATWRQVTTSVGSPTGASGSREDGLPGPVAEAVEGACLTSHGTRRVEPAGSAEAQAPAEGGDGDGAEEEGWAERRVVKGDVLDGHVSLREERPGPWPGGSQEGAGALREMGLRDGWLGLGSHEGQGSWWVGAGPVAEALEGQGSRGWFGSGPEERDREGDDEYAIAMGELGNAMMAEELAAVEQGSTRPEAGQAGTADEGGASDGRKGHGKGRALKVSPQARFDPGCFLKTVNRYGYSPLAVEWDLWLDPDAPGDLTKAAIVHRSAATLLVQAVFSMACLNATGIAGWAGRRVIMKEGLSPFSWLDKFGLALQKGCDTPPVLRNDAAIPSYLAVTAQLSSWEWVSPAPQAWGDRMDIRIRLVHPEPREPSHWSLTPPRASAARAHRARKDAEAGAGPVSLELYPIPDVNKCQGLGVVVEMVAPSGHVLRAAPVPVADVVAAGAAGIDVEVVTEPRVVADKDHPKLEDSVQARVFLRLASRKWTVLERFVATTGLNEMVARVCLAALSNPGGLFLDIKSAYSSGEDIECFVSALEGIGVEVRAVMTFQFRQRVTQVPSVFLFHGIWGLEQACDAGHVLPGDLVLFNGGSLLNDPRKMGDWATDDYRDRIEGKFQGDGKGAAVGAAKNKVTKVRGEGMAPTWDTYGIVDPVAFLRFSGLVEIYRFQAGIYVQETDCAAAFADAAIAMANNRPDLLPLGVAYGNLPASGIGTVRGQGLAAQSIINELEGRRRLSARLKKAVRRDAFVPPGASGITAAAAAAMVYRFMWGQPYMSASEQQSALMVMRRIHPPEDVMSAVTKLGGFKRVLIRFFEHYELNSPFMLFETGFLMDHTMGFVRLLRDSQGLVGLPVEKKLELAAFLCGPDLHGWGLNHWIQQWGWRRSLHLLAREALLCLFESCDAAQAGQVVEALGGKRRVDDLVAMIALFGFIRIRGLYSQRLDACLAHLAAKDEPLCLTQRITKDPDDPLWCPKSRIFPRFHRAYQYPRSNLLRAWLVVYKISWEVATWLSIVLLCAVVLPIPALAVRLLAPHLSRRVGNSATIVIALIGFVVGLIWAGVVVAGVYGSGNGAGAKSSS